MTVPAAARHLLRLTEGQRMAISVENSKVVAEPIRTPEPKQSRRRKYVLADLLVGYNARRDIDREWMDASHAGREIW